MFTCLKRKGQSYELPRDVSKFPSYFSAYPEMKTMGAKYRLTNLAST